MFRFKTLFSLLIVGLLSASCDKNETDPKQPDTSAKSKILITNPWRLSDVTSPTGTTIPVNRLDIQTRAIYAMDIQFFDNNVAKALDKTSRQVVNGGTWYLKENDQVLDIEISQFKGNFGVKELSRNKMSLNTQVPIEGVDTPAVLVFTPVVQ